jgi:hypothetical protein
MSPILVMPSIAKRAYVFRSASFYNLEFSVLVQFDLELSALAAIEILHGFSA